MVTIKKGLDLPILGEPEQRLEDAPQVPRVGLVGDDYVGMKPTMLVSDGDAVELGQPLFEDKKTPGVLYTSPAAGRVVSVVRGPKRKFESLVIEIEGDNRVEFDGARGADPERLGRDGVTEQLRLSGLWTALRTRPYGKVPAPGSVPRSIFVQAIDSNPLAADPQVVLQGQEDNFVLGLRALKRLTDGPVWLCKRASAQIPGGDLDGVRAENFAGPHPSGLVGTHIHLLDPVGPGRVVWYVGYQDVAAIGSFLRDGVLDVRRVVSLAGPVVAKPRLLETRMGAEIPALLEGEIHAGEKVRPISGSVLAGRTAREPHHFLGRYHSQVSVIREGDAREFLGWQKPGFDKFSTTRIFASAATPQRKFDFTSSTGGSERAMVPLGTYEKVMPLDILPTQLLRALIVRDTEQAQQLGALELEEEDLALCTFVCPGKYEYGSLLRENLQTIEREG